MFAGVLCVRLLSQLSQASKPPLQTLAYFQAVTSAHVVASIGASSGTIR